MNIKLIKTNMLDGNMLDFLKTLVEVHENKHYPFQPPDPMIKEI